MIHIITPEYPPQRGGVAHYTRQIARELARAGEDVHVWCPAGGTGECADAFTVHPELGHFGRRDLACASHLLDAFPAPRRLLVQWVPHGYGFRAMNVSFCWWLRKRAAAGDAVEIMVHEAFLGFGERGFRQNSAAVVQRFMTTILLRAARRVWVAIPAWERLWKPYAFGKRLPFTWLPIPSSLQMVERSTVQAVRARVAIGAGSIVGHFGTYGNHITALLDDAIPAITARSPGTRVLLIGAGSDEFRSRLIARHPDLGGHVSAIGELDHEGLAAHVAACDVLVQPYADGISSRRTTAMAGLALGVPVVTTRGRLTEPFWASSGSVRLSDVGQTQELAEQVVALLDSSCEREQLVEIGSVFYDRYFDVRHTITALRSAS